jgi:8-oxo-dGTP pyrophosphatase MutT (NUDIX family)
MAGNKYKIFIDGKPVIILPLSSAVQNIPGCQVLVSKGKQTVAEALEKINDEAVTGIVIRSRDADVTFHQLASRFTVVEAAGGLVRNISGHYLFIFRRGKWDLPKGKMDEGESIAQTALREVREECGLSNLKIISPLINTYHYYSEKNKNALKRTHWFLMSTDETEVTIETEEDIEDYIWLEKEKILPHISPNTFPNILELINECFDKL